MLLSATLFDQVFKLFKMTQTVRLEVVQWIEEAKECCTMLGGHHSWIWPYSGIAKPLAFPSLPLLEGQGSIMAGSNVNSDSEFHLTRQSSPDLSKALILHSIHFNFTHAHLLHLMPSQMTQLTVTMIYQSMTFSTIYLS